MGMTGGFAAQGVMSAGNSYAQGISQKAQSDYTAAQYGINAKLSGENAKLTTEDGNIQAGQMAAETKMQIGKQRTAAAATGADVSSGSAMTLQADTAWQGAQNQVMIKNNAWRTAWGYGVQANSDNAQASLSTLAGQNQLNNSYLTGGLNAFGYGTQAYGAYRKNNGKTTTTDGDNSLTTNVSGYDTPSFGNFS